MTQHRKLKFFMPMIPPTVTAQAKQASKRGRITTIRDSDPLKAARIKFRCHLAAHIPEKPLKAPLQCVLKFLWPISPKSKHRNGDWKTTTPDWDNIPKALCDELERLGFVDNDSHIADGTSQKFWADTPGVWVMLRELPRSGYPTEESK